MLPTYDPKKARNVPKKVTYASKEVRDAP